MATDADISDPVETVRKHIDAFNASDLDGLMACFSDEAAWVTGTDSFCGTTDLKELFANAFAGLAPKLQIESIIVDGNRVACELREDLVVDGVARSDCIAGFYRIESGRITAAKIYRQGSADV